MFRHPHRRLTIVQPIQVAGTNFDLLNMIFSNDISSNEHEQETSVDGGESIPVTVDPSTGFLDEVTPVRTERIRAEKVVTDLIQAIGLLFT